jgi:hypothetical protein
MKVGSRTCRATWVSIALGVAACAASQAAVLQQIAPASTTYVESTGFGDPLGVFSVMGFSGVGDVTGPVQAVDLMLGPGNTSTSGCEAADFAGFAAGSIALIQRSVCTFQQKAANALAAGAIGVLIFNQGNTPDREGVVFGTLGSTIPPGTMPVLGLSYALGVEFANTPGLRVRMVVTEADIATVPLPASLPLVALGLLLLGAQGRRRTG